MKKILQNIFSIKNEGDHKTIKLFGFSIKFKRTLLPRELAYLCEADDIDKAKKALEKYVAIHGYAKIHNYLPIAKLAKSIGITNEYIEKAVLVFDEFKKNKESKVFENLIKGKTVAIVGNGLSEIGRGKGAEIDAHDIVIRFNNYETVGFEKDYGTKTDIWIRGGGDDVQDLTKFNNYLCCCLGYDYYHNKMKNVTLDFLYDKVQNKSLPVVCLSDRPNLNINNPSTGLVAIWNVYLIKSKFNETLNPENIYGFSFLQDVQSGYAEHYFNDRSQEDDIFRSRSHNFHTESKFLKKLFFNKQGR